MRLGVISDIHGNGVALDAVLEELDRDGVDQLLCLGDAVQGGPQPGRVVRELRERGCPVVLGNADAWLLSGETTGEEPVSNERRRKMGEVREWSLACLSEPDRAFIRGFPPTLELDLPGGRRLLAFHGSPRSFDEFLFPHTPDDQFRASLEGFEASFFTGGHTHLQQLRMIGDGFFFNPGSVGLAYRHGQEERSFRVHPWAEYAVLTAAGERTRVEFRRVPFDVSALVREYRESGRPHADDSIVLYGEP